MAELGFGFMRLPLAEPNDRSAVSIAQVEEMVNVFLSSGNHYFDLGYRYHAGTAEKIFGTLVASNYKRNAFIVASKMPIAHIRESYEYEAIFQEQLQRCRIEYFDVYLLHGLNTVTYENSLRLGGFDFLSMLKKDARASKIGFSYHGSARALDWILSEQPNIDVVQLQLNYLDWNDPVIQSKQCYEICLKHKKNIIVMEPLKGGLLADLRKVGLYKLEQHFPDRSPSAIAIGFLNSLHNISYVLSGMTNISQVLENTSLIRSCTRLLDREIDILLKTAEASRHLLNKCTKCSYCIDVCPRQNVIPKYMELFNYYSMYGDSKVFHVYLNDQKKEKNLICEHCGNCNKICPQHIDVMKIITQLSILL